MAIPYHGKTFLDPCSIKYRVPTQQALTTEFNAHIVLIYCLIQAQENNKKHAMPIYMHN